MIGERFGCIGQPKQREEDGHNDGNSAMNLNKQEIGVC